MQNIVVFDAYGTLLNVEAAVIRMRGEIGSQTDRLAELWRTKQLEYSWVMTLMGRYRPFWELTEAALDYAIARTGALEPDIRNKLLAAYRTLDPYPDAAPALARLKRDGYQTAILSNADPNMLSEAVRAAGLDKHLDVALSVSPLQTYKTTPRSYVIVTEHFHAQPAEITFVSSNRWDVAGASAFGFETFWLNRSKLPDEYEHQPPAKIMGGLDELFGPPPERRSHSVPE